MACLGVHFGLTEAQREKLLGWEDDEGRLDYVKEEIEDDWDKEHLQETDKAWDAIHRCLIDHEPGVEELDWTGGSYPLNRVISGGRHLYSDKTYYVISLVEVDEVKDVAEALKGIDEEWMRRKYAKHCVGAWPEYDEGFFEYLWGHFILLREFYDRMAKDGRPVIFTVDQ